MKKLYAVLVVVMAAALVLTACGAKGNAGGDLLSDIKSRGYILVSTDPNYAPQSFLNTQGKRPSDSKCPSDALTTAEMQGFDVDVAAELGKRLGVETCFATPNWDAITAGNWADKWDVSVGSMTVTTERQKVLDFTTAYYYTPAVVAVTKESGITSLDQLSDKALCVGASTTYEDWLNGKLGIPTEDIFSKPPSNVTVVSLDTDQECAQALQAGRKDFVGYVTSGTVVDQNIANGLAVVKVGKAVYEENLAVAIDKKHTKDIASLLSTLDGFVKAMHQDGTLSTLSTKWFQTDLSQSSAG
ncbi:MAG TPA: transporter substrate-binding domain-containing protein [Anaerolineales bacterium]|nr:transporter substrate-binding domain-containing protein [Anaerolineales bacterium]